MTGELELSTNGPIKERNQCVAHKKNGERCQKAPIRGATVCRFHGGAARHVKAAAKARLENAADQMARQLLGIALDADAPPAVKLAAIKDALDRAGLAPNAKHEITHELKPWEQVLTGGVLRGPRPPLGPDPNVIDAEVVSEGEGAGLAPAACKGCGVDFSGYEPPPGGYPDLCRRCRRLAEPIPRPSPPAADEDGASRAAEGRPRRAKAPIRDSASGPPGTPGGLVPAEEAVTEAALGQRRERRKKRA